MFSALVLPLVYGFGVLLILVFWCFVGLFAFRFACLVVQPVCDDLWCLFLWVVMVGFYCLLVCWWFCYWIAVVGSMFGGGF